MPTSTRHPTTLPEPLIDPLRGHRARRLTDALRPTATAPDAAPDGTSRNHLAHGRLARLAEVLPPAHDLLRDGEWMAALSASTAVLDPTLYMTVVNHYVLCLGSVVASTEPGQIGGDLAETVTALESGHRKGVFLVTEVGDANSHLAIRTTAEFDRRHGVFVLRTPDAGAAKLSSVGVPGRPQSAVVCARLMVDGTFHGVHPFLVDLCDERRTAPGVTVSGALELDALPLEYALVRFDGARLPADRWLGGTARIDADGVLRDQEPGGPEAALHRTLGVGRLLWATVPTAAAATARTAAVAALRHSRHRRSHSRLAPGVPVLDYSTQQRALLGALAEAFALTCVAHTALAAWRRSEDLRTDTPVAAPGAARAADTAFTPWAAVDRRLSALKALATESAARVTAECRRRCGVAGYLGVNRVSGYAGLMESFRTAGGDNRLIFLDVGQAVAGEADPAAAHDDTRAAGPDHPAWWLETVTELERRLANGLRAVLDASRRDGQDGLDLWNPLLERVRRLGEVHALRLAARSVTDIAAPAAESDPLRRLAAFHGTTQALRLAGPLQWTGVLSPAEAAALETTAVDQCARLRPRLDELTALLAPPNELAPTPLAAEDYATALRDTLDRRDGGHS
ncbi:acyl-CoA dehydrogenase family protein [Streptomyces millisiae]|uniref:Acyl-CoA oxidase C-alpha1 domain-containing protein n=1 Tax=Streptomyces millisiae TaxID=3075542 RepID=A0ABU2LVN4_9ACTN|nr:hypothetical protein [Streptomyces sp. DSM 44918]MDT0321629.1 hypothetical protein [Streptomyces sp. DSM 44918]